MILEQMGCHKHGQPLCIYVAGAGGKTSWIHFLVDQERKKKKKVLILTSTHIYEPECFGSVREENGCQTLCQKKQWADEILSRLETWGVVIAGIRCGNGKITWVGDEVYERIKKGADRIFVEADGSRHLPIKVPGVVIAGIRCGNGKITWVGDEVYERIKKGADRIFVEADGSRHLPIKVPSSKEPVVFSDADLIFVTEGMQALGKPIGQVCHRAEEAVKILGCKREDPVTEPVVFSDADLIFVTEGMQALGKPIGQVCHRAEEAVKILGCKREDPVTEEKIRCMYRQGYEKMLKETYPKAKVFPVWVYPGDGWDWQWELEKDGRKKGIVWNCNGIYRIREKRE